MVIGSEPHPRCERLSRSCCTVDCSTATTWPQRSFRSLIPFGLPRRTTIDVPAVK
jgi:hypothetical protein